MWENRKLRAKRKLRTVTNCEFCFWENSQSQRNRKLFWGSQSQRKRNLFLQKIYTPDINALISQYENIMFSAIHGDKSQSERDHVLKRFRSGRIPILIATDVASRGLGTYRKHPSPSIRVTSSGALPEAARSVPIGVPCF